MPAVIPVVIAAGVSTLVGGGFIGALAATSFMVAWSSVTKPSAPRNIADTLRERTQIVRSAAAPRQIIYGECMVSGPLVFAESTGAEREYLHLVVALAGHEVENIGDVYLNDVLSTDQRYGRPRILEFTRIVRFNEGVYRVFLDGERILAISFDRDDFESTAELLEALADAINLATDKVTAAVVGDDAIRVTGVDHSKFDFGIATYNARAGGMWYLADASEIQTARGEVRINTHRGTSSQAADSDLVSEVSGWTSSHRLRGIAYIYARLKWNQDVWVTGIPNIRALTKGRKVYDPRTETTAWSDNWALCVLDYVRAPFGLNASDDEIDWDSFIAAANASDELVEVKVGEYQKRYTLNGAFTLDESPGQIIDKMLSAGAGELYYTEGKFRLRAGVYTAPDPADPITESDLRGDVVVHPRTDRKNLFNAVRGLYCSPDDDWQATDFPPVHNELYEDQDGGDRIYRDIELPFTTDVMRAQRIAKIALESSRQAITATLPCKPSAIRVALGKTYIVNLPRFGWEEKEFRVVGWTLNPDLSVDLVIREEAAASYAWNFGEATTKDPAPDTSLPNPREVAPPRNVAAFSGDEHAIVLADGSIMPRLYVTWDAPEGALIVGYEVRYTRTASAGDDDPVVDAMTYLPMAPDRFAYIGPVRAGSQYIIEVRSVNSLGARSPWRGVTIEAEVVEIAPEDPISLFAVPTREGIRLTWQAPSDPTIREYSLRKGDTFDTAVEIGRPAGPPFIDPLPITPGDYQYWVASVSRSGNISENKSTAIVSINGPVAPTVSVSVIGEDVVLTWNEPAASFPISYYTVNGTRVDGRRYTERVNHTGNKIYNVVAVDIAGNAGPAGTATATVLTQPAPTAITPVGLTYAIRVGLNYTRNAEFEALELWMADTNNRANARKVAETGDNVVNITGLPLVATRYFWARIRSKFGTYSDWYPSSATGGVAGSTSTNPTDYLEALAGHISMAELAEDVAEMIDAIPDLQSELQAVQAALADIQQLPEYDANEAVNEGDIVQHDGALYKAKTGMSPPVPEPPNDTYWEKIGDYASLGEAVAAHAAMLSSHETRIIDAEGELEAQAETIGLVIADLEDLELDLASRATIGYVDEAVAGEGLARAAQINQLTAEIQDLQQAGGNLIVNPSFELGLEPHYPFVTSGGGTWEVVAESGAYHGGMVLQHDSTGQTVASGVNLNGHGNDRSKHVAVRPGDVLRAEAQIRLKSGTAAAYRLHLRVMSETGDILQNQFVEVTPDSSWQPMSVQYEVTHPDASYALAVVNTTVIGPVRQVQFDDARLDRLDRTIYAAVHEASEAVAELDGVVSASYSVVVNANGHIVGFRLATDSLGNDSFDIVSNRFRIVNVDNSGNVVVPFVVGNINGTPSVGINGNLIIDGSVLARHIQVSSLSAIAADLGTVTAGLITGVRYRTSATGERIELNNPDFPNRAVFYGNRGDGTVEPLAHIGTYGSGSSSYILEIGAGSFSSTPRSGVTRRGLLVNTDQMAADFRSNAPAAVFIGGYTDIALHVQSANLTTGRGILANSGAIAGEFEGTLIGVRAGGKVGLEVGGEDAAIRMPAVGASPISEGVSGQAGDLWHESGGKVWVCAGGTSWGVLEHSARGYNETSTYAWCIRPSSGSGLQAGTIYAGSSLRAVGFSANSSVEGATVTMSAPNGAALTGTWRAMGHAPAITGRFPITLCKKIAD